MRPDADASTIRDSYRRLARVHHPDALGGSTSLDMAAINEAYRVLSDPGRRLDYDRELRAARASDVASSGSAHRPSSTARRHDPAVRDLEPPRFPWRFVLMLFVLGTTAVLVLGALMDAPPPGGVDNVLRSGDCVVIEPTVQMVAETPCDGDHDAVVTALVAFDSTCPTATESFRDRQGMGIACVERV